MANEVVVDGEVVSSSEDGVWEMPANEVALREMVMQTGASEISVKVSVLKKLFSDVDFERDEFYSVEEVQEEAKEAATATEKPAQPALSLDTSVVNKPKPIEQPSTGSVS